MNVKTKFYIVPFVVVAMIGAIVGLLCVAEGSLSTAVVYLESKSSNPWVTMALVAAGGTPNVDYLKSTVGSTAIDLEAPILALTAAGKDPRTFSDNDLVAQLKAFYVDGQLGDAAVLNDDIFGVLALVSAGESPKSVTVSGIKDFIVGSQNNDGGWPFVVGGTSDTNTTAAAIMALLEVGFTKDDKLIADGVAYLRSAQNDDGGFPYDPVSPWGTDSDASSDAWIISALYKAGENVAAWTKNGSSPIDHLVSLQKDEGYFQYQAGTGEDSFTPVTTSYAVVALFGKSYPISNVPAPAFPRVAYRIEGRVETVCSGEVRVPNPLELVKSVADDCGFTYNIKQLSFGPYLERIGSDQAEGSTGWLYAVDNVIPSVGAVDYSLEEGDDVLWYYGDFGWKLTRLSVDSSQVGSGNSVTVTVEGFESAGWLPLADATVTAGTLSQTTDAAGRVVLALADGAYKVFANKGGYIRSNQDLITFGNRSETQIDLSVIVGGSGSGDSGSQSSGSSSGGSSGGSVSFTVDNGAGGDGLDFGRTDPGGSLDSAVNLTNRGSVRIYMESIVSGDDIFRDYLTLDAKHWRQFNAVLAAGATRSVRAGLTLPATYSAPGVKNGKLVFWAVRSE